MISTDILRVLLYNIRVKSTLLNSFVDFLHFDTARRGSYINKNRIRHDHDYDCERNKKRRGTRKRGNGSETRGVRTTRDEPKKSILLDEEGMREDPFSCSCESFG